jgi:hypothetical protein
MIEGRPWWWFLLAMGTCFMALAKAFGRSLANHLDGTRTPTQRVADARWNTLVWRIVGGMIAAYAGWHLLGL